MRKLLSTLVLVLAFFAQALAQSRTITGRVTDANGTAIANASVLVKGTANGVSTDDNGDYSITVNPNDKALVFSFVGYPAVELAIGSRTVINVSLTKEDKALEEIVVVGYGTQKKKAVTASVSKINANNISTLVTPSIDKQLGGRAAGIQVTNSSGLVNQAPRIRIRGVNSINQGRDPLVVVDGVPSYSGGYSGVANTNALADINPSDIESVEVLKDGSATAIYGSRAANGVVLITTKKGRAGKSNVNFTSTFGFSSAFKNFDLLNAEQFVTIANEKLTNAGLAKAAFMDSANTNTDWQKVAMRNMAKAQNYNLGIDGGNERTTYFFSFNYATQEGLVKTNLAKRYGFRINIDHKINSWLKVGNNITLSRTEDNDQNNGSNALSGAIANALRAFPNVSPFDPSNTPFAGYNIKSDGSALGRGKNTRDIENNYTNLAFVLDNNKFKSLKNRIISNAFAEVRPFKGLVYRLQGSFDYNNGNDFQGLDPRHGDGRSSGGSVYNQSLERNRYILQNILNYNRTFGSHTLGLVAGHEMQRDQSNSYYGQGTNISDIFFLTNNIISGSFSTQFSGGGYGKSGFTSLFGRVNYDYKERYFAQFSVRRDGQSSLAKANRYGTFPGFSVGWRVSEEAFWSGLKNKINEFKIRGGFATVGNTLGGFPYLSTYSSAQYGGLNGIAVNLVGNESLTWETNKKLNVGFDMSILNNRFDITFDWFKNQNNDLVLSAPLPVSFGIPGNSVSRNIGDMENKGIELTLNAGIIRGKNFSWDMNFNYTNVKNKVKKLYLDQDVFFTYNILRVGEPINVLYGYNYAGVNSANGNPMYYKPDGTLVQGNIPNSTYYGATAGSATLGTQTTLSGGDRIILGNVIPTYFGGFGNTFRFKGFTMDMLFRYSGGNKIMNVTTQESLMNQGFINNGADILNRWTTAGQATDVPKLWYGRDNFTNLNGSANSRFVENGDFIRLDNLTLSYDFNKEALQSRISALRSLRFFVQGQNLWISSKFKGIDPDAVDEGGVNANVVPSVRTVSVGLNIGL